MAFAGAPVSVLLGAEKLRIRGVTLGPVAGPLDNTGAAPDSGLVGSNNGAIDPVLAGALSLPVNFGPGQDNWTQADADALEIALNDAGAVPTHLHYEVLLVANVNPAPAGSGLTNNNVQVTVHNDGAGAALVLDIFLNASHTIVR
jgi:hypothetical protein